jgi:hypothetical protein
LRKTLNAELLTRNSKFLSHLALEDPVDEDCVADHDGHAEKSDEQMSIICLGRPKIPTSWLDSKQKFKYSYQKQQA